MDFKLQVNFTNQFGETMTLALDDNNEVFFRHDDCNDDFEKYNDLLVKFKQGKTVMDGFNYVLDPIEKVVLNKFVEDAINNYGFKLNVDNIKVIDLDKSTAII